MKILSLILFVVIAMDGNVFGVTFDECEENARDIQNPTNYSVVPGFGLTNAFTPDEIEVYFQDGTNCNNANIIGYHAHNGDSTNNSNANDVETNFYYSNEFSYQMNVPQRFSSTSSNMDWVTYGRILNLDKDTFTIDAGVTNGDPFSGATNNDSDLIQGTIKYGSSAAPCRVKTITTDGKMNLSIISGVEGKTGCDLLISGTDENGKSHQFSSTINIESCEFSGNMKTSCMKEFSIKNSENKVIDATLKTNFFYFEFYDGAGNLIK